MQSAENALTTVSLARRHVLASAASGYDNEIWLGFPCLNTEPAKVGKGSQSGSKRNWRPAFVGRTPPACRSNNDTPISSSSPGPVGSRPTDVAKAQPQRDGSSGASRRTKWGESIVSRPLRHGLQVAELC